MRLNPEHTLRHLGSHYMIVDTCADNANLTNVFVLNSVAAFLWESVNGMEFTAQALVELLCDNYEVTAARAAADVETLLQVWRQYRLIL